MTKLACLLVFATFLHIGVSLTCYTCTDDTTCKSKSNWTTVHACGESIKNKTQATGMCLHEIYSEGVSPKQHVRRKCITVPLINGKATYNCSNLDKHASLCKICNTDFCNSAPGVNFDKIILTTLFFLSTLYVTFT